jgi:hypothetical protein
MKKKIILILMLAIAGASVSRVFPNGGNKTYMDEEITFADKNTGQEYLYETDLSCTGNYVPTQEEIENEHERIKKAYGNECAEHFLVEISKGQFGPGRIKSILENLIGMAEELTEEEVERAKEEFAFEIREKMTKMGTPNEKEIAAFIAQQRKEELTPKIRIIKNRLFKENGAYVIDERLIEGLLDELDEDEEVMMPSGEIADSVSASVRLFEELANKEIEVGETTKLRMFFEELLSVILKLESESGIECAADFITRTFQLGKYKDKKSKDDFSIILQVFYEWEKKKNKKAGSAEKSLCDRLEEFLEQNPEFIEEEKEPRKESEKVGFWDGLSAWFEKKKMSIKRFFGPKVILSLGDKSKELGCFETYKSIYGCYPAAYDEWREKTFPAKD